MFQTKIVTYYTLTVFRVQIITVMAALLTCLSLVAFAKRSIFYRKIFSTILKLALSQCFLVYLADFFAHNRWKLIERLRKQIYYSDFRRHVWNIYVSKIETKHKRCHILTVCNYCHKGSVS